MKAKRKKKAKRRLFLVHAPIDEHYQDAEQHYAPPLGLVSLKTTVQRGVDDAEVTLIDGTQTSSQNIISTVLNETPNIVGVSVQQVTYANSLRIAAAAKQVGAAVVFGGQHATQLAPEIISNRHSVVDTVVRHDGELPLLLICQGIPFSSIPGLTYWDDGVRQTPAAHCGLHVYPNPDYSDVDLQPYVEHYTKRQRLAVAKTFLRTYSHKGCGNRLCSNACYFCGRADKGVRFKTPQRYVQELVELADKWGASEAFDVGDDIAFQRWWLREVAHRVEADGVKLDLGCFGRASRLRNRETAHLLNRIGITNIIIGFESGDPDILRNCGKGSLTPEVNFNAARNLFDEGIDTCASYVIGLPGENEASLSSSFALYAASAIRYSSDCRNC